MKPNVLQLIGSFNEGGSERQAVQLACLLSQSGCCRVQVACLNRSGALLAELGAAGLTEIPEYRLTRFYDRRAALQLTRFARYLREQQIHVVHTHDFYTNIFGMAAATLAGVPARIASRREIGVWRTAAQMWVEHRAFALAHRILVNADALRRPLLKRRVPERKIVTVRNGIDVHRVAPQPNLTRRAALSLLGLPLESERRLVTIVANMRDPVKDHPMFLRAACRVHAAVPEAAFVLAGEGELAASIRAQAAQLGLAEAVFFIGACRHIAELLAASDVCVLSSRAEGSSNAILEYMAAARPVVATDVGGAREAVIAGRSGYLVPSGDDAAMAERITALLREPERARGMGEQGRQIVVEKYSCEAQLERIRTLYSELLEQRGFRIAEVAEPARHTGVVS